MKESSQKYNVTKFGIDLKRVTATQKKVYLRQRLLYTGHAELKFSVI